MIKKVNYLKYSEQQNLDLITVSVTSKNTALLFIQSGQQSK